MFTTEHFIWLGICAVIIAVMLIISKRFNFKIDLVVNIILIVSLISEITKTLCSMLPSPHMEGGRFLDPGDLPLHLCSIQIFITFAYKYICKSEKSKQTILAFQAPTMLLGATIALFVPTVGVEFTNVQVYQYFIYHAFIIFYPIYILREKLVAWKFKTYGKNMAIIGIIAFIVLWINSALSVSVCTCEQCLAAGHNYFDRANFMYLTYPPMEGLPLLNLNNGWYVYFITLALLVAVLMLIFHLLTWYFYEKRPSKKKEQ